MHVNDMIVSVDGSETPGYTELIQIIGALGRPVVVGIQRGSGGGRGGTAAAATGGAGARGQETGPFQRAQEAARRKMDEMKGPPQVGRGPPEGIVLCYRHQMYDRFWVKQKNKDSSLPLELWSFCADQPGGGLEVLERGRLDEVVEVV